MWNPFESIRIRRCIGVLIKAKRQGIIDSLYPFLAEMKQNGFYIDPMLEEMVLQQAGER